MCRGAESIVFIFTFFKRDQIDNRAQRQLNTSLLFKSQQTFELKKSRKKVFFVRENGRESNLVQLGASLSHDLDNKAQWNAGEVMFMR